jgi:hypothetical protein
MSLQEGYLMFGRKSKVVAVKLDEVIERITQEMDKVGPYSPEYPKLIGHLQRIVTLRNQERGDRRISPDVVITAVANLLGIGIIVAYERMHVMTSKAVGFVLKPK